MRNETFKNLLLSASLISASAFLSACGNDSKKDPATPVADPALPEKLKTSEDKVKSLEQQIANLQTQKELAVQQANAEQQKILEQKLKEAQDNLTATQRSAEAERAQILGQAEAEKNRELTRLKTQIETLEEQAKNAVDSLAEIKLEEAYAYQKEVLEKIAKINQLQNKNLSYDIKRDDIFEQYQKDITTTNQSDVVKLNRDHKKFMTFDAYFKAFAPNYDAFKGELDSRPAKLITVETGDTELNTNERALANKVVEIGNDAEDKLDKLQAEATSDMEKIVSQDSEIFLTFHDTLAQEKAAFANKINGQNNDYNQDSENKQHDRKEAIREINNDLTTWNEVDGRINKWIKLDQTSINAWKNIFSIELFADGRPESQFIGRADTELKAFLETKIIDMKKGTISSHDFVEAFLTAPQIMSSFGLKRQSRYPLTLNDLQRNGKEGKYFSQTKPSIKGALINHLINSDDAKYLRTLFADTSKEAFKELLKDTYEARMAAARAARAAAGVLDNPEEEDGVMGRLYDGLSSTTPRDYSEKVSFFKVRKAVNGFADISGLKVNGASGESIALGMPLFIQLNGDVSSSKATDATSGSVAYRLGNTVIGAIQSYANSGEGFGVDGRQLETSIVASQSFGSFFVEGQLGTVSATDVYNSSWKGMRSQVILGLDTEFVSPFVQITHRELDRSGINLNQTTGYLGLEMDVAKLQADSYSVDARLTAKVGYGEKAWSIKATDIGTTTGFNGSVEWSGTLNLNSGVKFTTNLGLDTVAGSSAAVNVSLDR